MLPNEVIRVGSMDERLKRRTRGGLRSRQAAKAPTTVRIETIKNPIPKRFRTLASLGRYKSGRQILIRFQLHKMTAANLEDGSLQRFG